MITFQCSACETIHQAKDDQSWIRFSCPECGLVMTVPAQSTIQAPVSVPAVVSEQPAWFYIKEKRKLGPVSLAELQQLVASGQLAASDMVLALGGTKWAAVAIVPELSLVANSAASPPEGLPVAVPVDEPVQGTAPIAMLAESAPPADLAEPTAGATPPGSGAILEAIPVASLPAAAEVPMEIAAIGGHPKKPPQPRVPRWLMIGGVAVFVVGFGMSLLGVFRGNVQKTVGTTSPTTTSAPIIAAGKSAAATPPVVADAKSTAPVSPPPPVASPSTVPAADLSPVALPRLVLDTGGHTVAVSYLAFTPDGKHLLSVADDKCRVWDMANGETVRIFRVPGELSGVALSPDGRTVALGNHAEESISVFLVGWESGRVEKVLQGQTGSIKELAFSRDGSRLAAAGLDRKIRIWDVRTGRMEWALEGHAKELENIAFSPDGQRLLSIGRLEPQARIWSLKTGKTETVIENGKWEPRAIAWSPDGQTVAITTLQGDVTLWGPDGTRRGPRMNLGTWVVSVTFTPDSREMLVTGPMIPLGDGSFNDNLCSLVDVASGKERLRFPLHTGMINSGAFSSDGKLVATAGGERHEIHIWRTADGSPVAELMGTGASVWEVSWSPDGQAIGWRNHRIRRSFDLGKLEFGGGPTADFLRPNWLNGNRTLGKDATGRMVIKQDGRVLHSYVPTTPGNPTNNFTWLHGNRVVVVNVMDLVLVDADTGKEVRTYQGQWGATTVAPSPDGKFFVTGGQDQTIRIWDVERSTPVLSLFFTDQDWVAWTAEGVYAASVGGERLVGWQLAHRPEALASYYPAAQFHKSLYLPEVIRELVPAGGLAQAWVKAGKKGKVTDIAHVLPPEVSITSPAGVGTISIPGEKFEVKASAQSRGKHPVTGMRLLMNGRPYQGQSSFQSVAQPHPGSVSASWTVQLPPGPYTLAVVAESSVSRSVSAPVAVSLGTAPNTLPKLYVLAIGINAYTGGMRLRYAAPDADALTQTFRERSAKIFQQIEVRVIKDKQATRRGIEEGLAWMRSKMTAQDVGIFSFSGHGNRDPDGQFFLIPVDVNPRDLRTSCVSGDALKQALAEMPGQLIAVLDACHSGAATNRPELRRDILADDLVRDLVSEDYGIIVYSSSQGREFSLEDPEYKQGLFTLAVLEGLKGQVNLRSDGLVSLKELEAYASKRVRILSSGVQNPVMLRPALIRSFPLSQADPAAPRPPPLVTIPGSKAAAIRAYHQGTAFGQQGKPREALAQFDEAIRLYPRLHLTYGNRAIIRRDLGQQELALQDLNTALTLEPDYARAWHIRGGIRLLQERHADAIRDLTEAIRVDPKTRGVWQMRGSCFRELHLLEQAVKDLDEAIRQYPQDVEAYENRGLALLDLRKLDAALADFNRMIQLNPRDPDGYGQRARVYAAQGKHAEADRELEQCRKLNPEVAKYHETLAYPNGRPKP